MTGDIDDEFAEVIDTVGPRRRRAPGHGGGQRHQPRRPARAGRTAAANVSAKPALAAPARRGCDTVGRGHGAWWGAPVPRCTGEEMVLHLILRRAAIADTSLPTNQACAGPHSADPRGWGDLFEFLFQDHGVLMLYDMPAQSAESAAGAVNLDPSRWFSEFSPPLPCPRPTHMTARKATLYTIVTARDSSAVSLPSWCIGATCRHGWWLRSR